MVAQPERKKRGNKADRADFGPPPEHPLITYVRTFPYGAPKVRLYGQTFHVKEYLKTAGFRWKKETKMWEGYFNTPEVVQILADLVELHGCKVEPGKLNKQEEDLTVAVAEEIRYRNEE